MKPRYIMITGYFAYACFYIAGTYFSQPPWLAATLLAAGILVLTVILGIIIFLVAARRKPVTDPRLQASEIDILSTAIFLSLSLDMMGKEIRLYAWLSHTATTMALLTMFATLCYMIVLAIKVRSAWRHAKALEEPTKVPRF